MNVLLFDDLFIEICLYLRINSIVKLELISKYHMLLIRKTSWIHGSPFITNMTIFDHIVKHYKFKNLFLNCDLNVNSHIDYLMNCHTLDLSYTSINNDNIKRLGYCYTLNLSATNITDNCVKFLKNCHILHLDWNKITDKGIEDFKGHILSVRGTKISVHMINILRQKGCIVYDIYN